MNDITSRASYDQARASDPTVSAWVSANAGSGKTHVLVNRVIRLMLTGTPPEKILCLTYTKAAAAEMSNRLYERLAEWIPLDDDALIEKIHQNTGHIKFGKDQLAEPRRLFARALETPGGLKIQTIHAFCEQLLHRFPLEAGITSGFKVMDDREANELLVKIRSDFFVKIDNADNDLFRNFLAEVVKFSGGQQGFDELLGILLNKRDELYPVYQDLTAAYERLADALGVQTSDTIEKLMSQASNGLNRTNLTHAQKILEARTTKTDQNQGALLKKILLSDVDQDIFEALKKLTLKANGEVKSEKTLCTVKCGQDNPDVLAILQDEALRIIEISNKIKALSVLQATNAALHMGKIITEQYENEKNLLGFYDYHDLIAKVLAMFAEMPDAAWVLYKLDGGLDHILIDEAQDTSPAQWDIIQFLADDFFSGSGARQQDIKRSIFAVGDRKQSIYSFQGAAPESFDQRKHYFRQMVEQAERSFESVDFDVSFRSTAQVLRVVDEVFEQPIAANGVDTTVHSAVRTTGSGIVELWPIEEKQDATKTSVWVPDTGEKPDSHPRVRLAEKIARKIKNWLVNKEMLPSKNRPITPGDILILVRRRTQMMNALVRALKLADIPVAGVDRLKLTEHIGVQDLMALARFVLLPEDDLNFAGLLKSSLLTKDDGSPFNDDDLVSIAAERDKNSVWKSFLHSVEDGARYQEAKSLLMKWQAQANLLLPFEFFSNVLSADNKRVTILQRLGSEAGEPIDAFLLLAQDFERTNIPTLQGFLSWVETGDTEIKREMDKSDSEVRIMTIHGAKGLEANIVILPDTYDVPDTQYTPKILDAGDQTPVWRLKSEFEVPLTNELKAQHLADTAAEYNRLLYVAMTRACDRLYIGAAQSNSLLKENSWYKLTSNVLQREELETPDDVFGKVWRFCETEKQTDSKAAEQGPVLIPAADLPAWVSHAPSRDSQTDDKALNWIAPSKFGSDDVPENEASVSPLAGITENRFLRGNLIHKMLQYLPAVAPERQRQVARDYMNTHGYGLSDDEQTATLAEIDTILTDNRFAAVFAPGSIAEAPIVARIIIKTGEEVILNGQIDRLCIHDNEILIVDYKTNRPPPASDKSVNQQYIRQLAAYRLALREIYPNHAIHAGLLWTHNAVLMEIDEKRLIDVFSQ